MISFDNSLAREKARIKRQKQSKNFFSHQFASHGLEDLKAFALQDTESVVSTHQHEHIIKRGLLCDSNYCFGRQ